MQKWVCVVLLGLGAGCSDSPIQSSTVSQAGGAVAVSNGTAVSIPAGALNVPTAITIETLANGVPPTGTQPVGQTYHFGPEGQTFAQPVAVKLAVALDQLPPDRSINDVIIYTAPAGSTAFTPLPTTVSDMSHVVASTTHFSLFIAIIVTAPVSGGDSGPLADLSQSPLDAAPDLKDMSMASDMMSLDMACPAHNFVGGSTGTSTCTLTGSCGGHAYQVSCTSPDMSGWVCTCSKDGSATKTLQEFPNPCGAQTNLEGYWVNGCLFP